VTTQNVVLELFLGGVWTPVPLYSAAGSVVTRGMDAGGSWPSPSSIETEINNDSLNYDPSNPTSTIYGTVGRNTRARLKINGNTRLWAEASQWNPDRTIEHVAGAGKGRAWTKLTAEGVLRRLGLWEEPLRSPMYRTNSLRTSSIGHWPLEDDKDSSRLANTGSAFPSYPGSLKGGVVLGESESPDGAKSTAKVAVASQMSGRFGIASGSAGWQVCLSFKMPNLPVSATYGTLLQWHTNQGYRYTFDVNNANFRVSVIDSFGTSLLASAVAYTGREPNQWLTFRVKVSWAAGTVTVEPAWYRQGDVTEVGWTDTFAATSAGALSHWFQNGDTIVDGTWFSHIFGVTGGADSLVGATAQQIFNGYRGEPAGTRYLRVCAENNVTRFIISSVSAAADTQAMGPQRADTLISILKEIVETDDCRIDDERFDIGLTMTTRRAMTGQTPALTLTYPAQVKPPFKKIIGDKASKNRVTVKNRDGGEVTAELLAGAMSVLAPPAGIGEAKGSVDVNVSDETAQLEPLAAWHLAKGTLERPRYESVSVDLLANPGLEASVNAVREGNLIRVTGYEAEPIDLIVTGIVSDVGAVEHTVTFKTEPAEPYRTGRYDDGVGRYDARTSTVNAAQTTTSTAWAIKATDANDVWSTATPYDWIVAGERVTVTAMTAAAGTGPYTQTATVVRSVNGVVKAQAVGNEIHIANARRWGL
jgi:hypothetical protein